MKIFKITLASHGLPPMYPSDLRNFLIDFLGYTEIHTKGSHHKFQKPGYPNAGGSFNEDGELKGDSGLKPMLAQLGINPPLFMKYWNNRKQWLKKARLNREDTLKEFFDLRNKQNENNIPVQNLTKNNDKLDTLVNTTPYLKRYFQSVISYMPKDQAYQNLYNYVLSIDSLKDQYLKL